MTGYGVFSVPARPRRLGWAIDRAVDGAGAVDGAEAVGGDGGRGDGGEVLDLAAASAGSEFEALLAAPSLNPLLAAGRPVWRAVQAAVGEWVAAGTHRVPVGEVELHLPFQPGDFVDFYSNENHARNASEIFRPGEPGLAPNWKHLPVGYHSRAGSVVVSGTPVVRPAGQRPGGPGEPPRFGPTKRLDIEAEIGFVLGSTSAQGTRIPIGEADEHVFGVFLLNDWSARDIQGWESLPLGPHLGKSFATSISPWVVPLEALEHARVEPPARDPEPLPYLRDAGPAGLEIAIEVRLNGQLVSSPPFATNYWTYAQQLAHLTVNGAPTRPGDMFGSGTVSGPERAQRGSFLELSWGGREPLELPDGATRTFLEDGDEVVISASAPGPDGTRISFGELAGTVLPALPG